jgi:hypothetical protein
MSTHVTTDNFVRLETERMFRDLSAGAGGVGKVLHLRVPTPLDAQTVIRMNRDTLYSLSVVDLAQGATITMPDSGERYASLMVINQDHYINRVIHDPGEYHLTVDEFGTRWVCLGMRVFVDPNDAADVAAANAVQDQFTVSTPSNQPLDAPDHDEASFEGLRHAVLELARYMPNALHAFGSKDTVDPVRHLVGTAMGWGGLPEFEAYYGNVDPALPVGEYRMTVGDVPVDAFWSISLYNADGFFEPGGGCSVNSVTAQRDDDGTVTVHFGGPDERPNHLRLMDGWNYIVRMYRPHPEVLDGTWTFPALEPVS